ncbi:MAG TPA: NAD-dependent epimerase/dehydratase family protein [Ruminiclostridium sp.]|nr:NAD-dependent epimerase/dehydratase family protein [Ruminiclostridium sp.]
MREIEFTDKIMQEDFRNFSARSLPWEKLQNVTVLVTGATGLIGSTLVKTLAYCNSVGRSKIKILCVVRNHEKAAGIFKEALPNEDIEFIVQDIAEPVSFDGEVDYIIHAASVTSSKMFVTKPVETIMTAVNGTKNILDFAVEKKVKGFVYLSSMEVYGVFDGSGELKTESDYGLIDPLQVRSSYSESKRMVECLCKSYQSEKNVPVRIARLVQTFGPGVEKSDNRVFAQFARSVINKEDIILHTKGETKRKYLYTIDAVYGILLLMLDGADGEAYNVANPDSFVSIYDMACLASQLDPTGKVKVKIEIEDINKFGYAPMLIMNLSTAKIEALGWKASVGLKEAFERMIKSMTQND